MSADVDAHTRTVLFGAAHVERGSIVWKMPLRSSIVVSLLVIAMVLHGEPAAAIPVAIGALFAAVVDVGEHIGYRWRIMLWTTLWLMVATAVAQAVSQVEVLLFAVTIVMAIACGITGALGPRAGLAGLLSLVVFTIYAGSPELAADAAPDVLLIGLGGVVQTAVTVLPVFVFHPSLVRRPTRDGFVLTRLRGHLTWSDPFLRHSLRLAVALTLATALAALIDEPHSYWIPMTVAWMAKPDKDGTATRVIARILGTIGGVLAVALLMSSAGDATWMAIVVVMAGSMLALAFIWANYAIAVVGITVFVIALFSLAGGPVGETVDLRVLDTVLAGVITFGCSFLWPVRPQATAAPE